MNIVYLYEFIGTGVLAFFIALLGKGYAHTIFGIMILCLGTIFVTNCFNPAIALCFLLTNKIQLFTFLYYIPLELAGAVVGYYGGKYVHKIITK